MGKGSLEERRKSGSKVQGSAGRENGTGSHAYTKKHFSPALDRTWALPIEPSTPAIRSQFCLPADLAPELRPFYHQMQLHSQFVSASLSLCTLNTLSLEDKVRRKVKWFHDTHKKIPKKQNKNHQEWYLGIYSSRAEPRTGGAGQALSSCLCCTI